MPSMPPERPTAVLLPLERVTEPLIPLPPTVEALEGREPTGAQLSTVQLNITLDINAHVIVSFWLQGKHIDCKLPVDALPLLARLACMLAHRNTS